MVVGLTGGYCSGKDLAASIFEKKGFYIIDVDRIGHEALKVKRNRVREVFGNGVMSGEEVDRKKLGAVVFGDRELKERLESIAHPWMREQVALLLQEKGDTVINAALLIEMGLDRYCGFVLAITADHDIAVRRGVMRDGVTEEEAEARLGSQILIKAKLDSVDKVIENNGSVRAFTNTIESLIAALRSGT